MRRMLCSLAVLTGCLLATNSTLQAGVNNGTTTGDVTLKQAGPLAFGPKGVLFIADPMQASVFAVETGDMTGKPAEVAPEVKALNEKIAALLGTTAKQVQVVDLAVNPTSGNVYASVNRGQGPEATPVIVKVTTAGEVSVLSLKNVKHAKATLPNAPEDKVTGQGRRRRNPRGESITDIAFLDDQVIIAGLSNEEFASNLRAIPFPFTKVDTGTSVEIFHGAHGRFETRSPVRTFTPFMIDGKPQLVAAYTCTPLVRFPLSELQPGIKVKGTTIAELGNRNRPLDMITYTKDGGTYILMANSSRGVMKINMKNAEKTEAITERISGIAGQPYDTIEDLKGVVQLDRLNDTHAVILVETDEGALNLQTIALP